MNYTTYHFPSGVEIAVSSFTPAEGGVTEHHLIFSAARCEASVKGKTEAFLQAFRAIQRDGVLGDNLQAVFCRWFLSDAANQSAFIDTAALGCASSIIEQPPLDGSKVALWIYCLNDVESCREGENLYAVSHGAYRHLWLGDQATGPVCSEVATSMYLTDYARMLDCRSCSLLDNCLRTWFFVRDVDVNYKGVVTARNKVFSDRGLTVDNHFIASTGIGGRRPDGGESVAFNAYAVEGLQVDQVRFLKAPTHLNSTMDYGVAFERGTTVDYGDRRHVLVSGTASIDRFGEIVHPGDIARQTLRMLENVEALLAEAGAGWTDVGHFIVYLRDLSDYGVVKKMIGVRFPEIPTVIVHAPVCRPGWLVEMECMAVTPARCLQFAPL